eukprot:6171895-Pleurochrysis_carterae.AAC.4
MEPHGLGQQEQTYIPTDESWARAHSYRSARTMSANALQAQHFTCPPSPGHESESGATSV